MLKGLQNAVIRDENVFAVLTDAVRVCSLGQTTHALFEVGGQYRSSMSANGPRPASSGRRSGGSAWADLEPRTGR